MTGELESRRRRPPPKIALWLLHRHVPAHEREYFIGDLIERFESVGLTPAEQRAARRRFWLETCAALARRSPDHYATPFTRGFMFDIAFDISLALRRLRRSPIFTLCASLTLALGVGAACAIFAVARPVLWSALPFRNAEEIVKLRENMPDGSASDRLGFSTVADIGRSAHSLSGVAAVTYWTPTLTEAGGAERLTGIGVSAPFFDVMGIRPLLGRGFLPEEDRPEGARVAILGYGLWQRRFGGDSSIVGRSIKLSEIDFQVVGIMPASFESLPRPGAEILQPLRYADSLGWACRSCRHIQGYGRLGHGTTALQANQELSSLFTRMRAQYVDDYGTNTLTVEPLRETLVAPVRAPLYALLGAAGLLLLIALANVTNLLVARAIQRESETLVRAALGAGRWRLVRGLLLEALVVALLGALFGAALAQAGVGTLIALAPPSLPRLHLIRVDGPVIVFVAAVSLLMGVASGLLPSVVVGTRTARRRLHATTRTVARGARDTLRRGLVIFEVALALMLLTGASLLIQSVQRLLTVDVGFATDHRLSLAMTVSGPRFNDEAVVHQTWRAVRDAVLALPGVASASLTSQLPMSIDSDSYGIHRENAPARSANEDGDAYRFAVTPDYAATMGLTLRQGRFLEVGDVAGSMPVVVINETMAGRDYPGQNPLGQRVKMGGMDGPWRTIVGVVSNVRHHGLDSEATGQIYLPLVQNSYADAQLRLVVHTTTDPSAMMPALRAAIAGVDPNIPVAEVMTLRDMVLESTAQRGFAKRMFQVFALSALVLAAVGIFGVLSSMVGERTREVGVRSALGATRGQIVGHFIRQGLTLALLGVATGTAGALALATTLRSLVFGISPRDPITLLEVAVALTAIALVATFVPAWKAARMDAVVALRAE